MKKLIRNKADKTFLGTDGNWTQDVAKAQAFLDERTINQARVAHRLRDCEIYYLFGEAPSDTYDFSLALMDYDSHKEDN
jgi:hypothetical protein